MPIAPGQVATTSAQLKRGRVGAMRLRYAPTTGAVIIIGNVDRTNKIRLGTVDVSDIINDTPNTCDFIANYKPTAGQDIKITYPNAVLFGGAIERVEQIYEGEKPVNLAWRVTCQDYTRLLTRKVINKTYAEQSASTIAGDLIAGTGISNNAVASGLPVIAGGLDIVDLTPRAALTKLVQKFGGYWYVDYNKILHLFITDNTPPPDALLPWPQTPSLMNDPPVTYEEDITQLRTRVIVTGAGSTTLVPIAVGGTSMPIQDATMFASSGELKSETLRFSYGGRVVGGFATNVGSSIAAPTTPPSAAIAASQVGSIVGVVSYKYSFKNASGETLPSPASNTVTGVAFSAPTGAPFVGVVGGLGRLIGLYSYRITNVTDRGETTPGPPSSTVAPVAVTPPGPPSLFSNGLGPLIGSYQYACTYVTQYGETNAGAVSARTATAVAVPATCTAAEVASTIGPIVGAYSYRVGFVTPYGETLGNQTPITVAAQTPPAAPAATGFMIGPLIGNYSYFVSFLSALGETLGTNTNTFNLPVITAGSPGVAGDGTGTSIAYAVTITHPLWGESALSARTIDTNKGSTPVITFFPPSGCGWNIYSTGTTGDPFGASMFKVAECAAGTTSFTHTTQTGPQAQITPTMGYWVQITGIPQGPSGTTARRIYRTKANGSAYYLVGQIDNNNAGQIFNDTSADTALTIQTPAVNLNGKAVSLTNIQAGPVGTLARRVYRTKAGGSTYFLVGALGDNSTTSLVDTTPDAALTQNAPIGAAAGGEQFSIGLPIGPSGTVGRRLYRTAAGGSTFRLAAEVPDNVTGAIVDALSDGQLSPVTIPVTNTAGGQNVQLTGIQTGPTGTLARRVYRTRAGGSEYFLVGQLSDNVTGSFVDSLADGSLGATAPIINDAGASAVTVNFPAGPFGTTARRLFRTEGGGSVYRFVTEIKDNTTLTFTDGKADTSLGDVPLDISTIGALPKATTLAVVDGSGFANAGWARVDSQLISWGNKSGNTLIGIPLDGDGAIKSAISAGSGIVAVSVLTSVAGLTLPLVSGASVNLLVQRDDPAAQAALAAREGFGNGVIEYPISDTNLSAVEATARADAELALFAKPLGRVKYCSRDLKTASGKRLPVNIPQLGVNGYFTIQSVNITEIGIAGLRANPLYTVEASTLRFSIEDALRRLLSGMGGL